MPEILKYKFDSLYIFPLSHPNSSCFALAKNYSAGRGCALTKQIVGVGACSKRWQNYGRIFRIVECCNNGAEPGKEKTYEIIQALSASWHFIYLFHG